MPTAPAPSLLKQCAAFLDELRRAREWDATLFANDVSACFRANEERTAAGEALLSRIMAAAGVSSCSTLASQQRVVESVAGTFDALAVVPLLFGQLESGAAAGELAAWAADEHQQQAEQRVFFGARSDMSPDVHTLVVEHFLERTTAAFVERLLPGRGAAATAGEVCEWVLGRLLDTFELPQALLFVAKRLYRQGALAGLVLGSLLGGALAREAKTADEQRRAVLLAAKQQLAQMATELGGAPTGSSLGRSSGSQLSQRVKASFSLKRVEESLGKLDDKLRTSAGKIEAALHRGPRGSGSNSGAASPLPQEREGHERTAPDALGDEQLASWGVSENMTHEQVLQLQLSPRTFKMAVAELLRRPGSRVCSDAMRALEGEGMSFAGAKELPLLPARPPSVANRTLYKNYMRLKFEHAQRSSVDSSAQKLVDDIFSDGE